MFHHALVGLGYTKILFTMKDITGGSYMQMPITSSFSVGRSLQWQSTGISLSKSGMHREPHPPYAVNQLHSQKTRKSNSGTS